VYVSLTVRGALLAVVSGSLTPFVEKFAFENVTSIRLLCEILSRPGSSKWGPDEAFGQPFSCRFSFQRSTGFRYSAPRTFRLTPAVVCLVAPDATGESSELSILFFLTSRSCPFSGLKSHFRWTAVRVRVRCFPGCSLLLFFGSRLHLFFALFKVEDSPRSPSTNSTSVRTVVHHVPLGVPVTLNPVCNARRQRPADWLQWLGNDVIRIASRSRAQRDNH